MQIDPRPVYHHGLAEMAIAWLQTKDPSIFPFTTKLDDEQRKAFARDLRIALNDITESGSKRGTSSVGFPTSDRRLWAIIDDWAAADGGWPETQDPTNPYGIGGVAPFDVDPEPVLP